MTKAEKVKAILIEELGAKGFVKNRLSYAFKNVRVWFENDAVFVKKYDDYYRMSQKYLAVITFNSHQSINRTLRLVDKLCGIKREKIPDYKVLLGKLGFKNILGVTSEFGYSLETGLYNHVYVKLRFASKFTDNFHELTYKLNDLEGIKRGAEFLIEESKYYDNSTRL